MNSFFTEMWDFSVISGVLIAWLTSFCSSHCLLLPQNLSDKYTAWRPNLIIFCNNSKKALHLSNIFHPKKTLLTKYHWIPSKFWIQSCSFWLKREYCLNLDMVNTRQHRHHRDLCNTGKQNFMQTNQNNPLSSKKIHIRFKDSPRKDSPSVKYYEALYVYIERING